MSTLAGPSRHLTYQPALDGVRAVAVVAVLLFHGGVAPVAGGFLGVDVFFVLSGYLITTLLVREGDRTGRIDLVAFYRRRARRLMPALLLTLGVVAVYGVFLAPGDWHSVRADGVASLLYVPNWHFIFSEQSYFDQFSSPSPLRHMWSLGIEEQWYLVWPAVLGVALRKRVRRLPLAVLTVAGAAASAVWMAALSNADADPSRAYYGTDTRAQALLAGAALAFVLPSVAGRVRSISRWVDGFTTALGGAALAALVVVMATTSESDGWLYEGGFALVAALAVVLIGCVAIAGRSPLARFVGASPLAAIGRVSYGLYLFHWPVFVALTPERIALSGTALLALRLAVTVAITVVSYRLVEQPIRLHPRIRLARPAAVAVAVLGAVFLVPATVRPADAPAQQLAATDVAVAAATGAAAPSSVTDRAELVDPLRVLVVGDSVAVTLAVELQRGRHPGVTVDAAALLGCGLGPGRPVVNGRTLPTRAECTTWPDEWARQAQKGADVAVVVVGAWEVADQKIGARVVKALTDEGAATIADRLRLGIDALGDRPVAVLTVPCYSEASRVLGGGSSPRNDTRRVAWVNEVITSVVAERANTFEADLNGFLCPEGEPRLDTRGEALRYDGVHFTASGAEAVWSWLLPRLRDVTGRGSPAV